MWETHTHTSTHIDISQKNILLVLFCEIVHTFSHQPSTQISPLLLDWPPSPPRPQPYPDLLFPSLYLLPNWKPLATKSCPPTLEFPLSAYERLTFTPHSKIPTQNLTVLHSLWPLPTPIRIHSSLITVFMLLLTVLVFVARCEILFCIYYYCQFLWVYEKRFINEMNYYYYYCIYSICHITR